MDVYVVQLLLHMSLIMNKMKSNILSDKYKGRGFKQNF